MLKMPSFGMNTRPEMFVPLIRCVGDTIPSHEALLQFIDVMKLISVANVSTHASMPKEDFIRLKSTHTQSSIFG